MSQSVAPGFRWMKKRLVGNASPFFFFFSSLHHPTQFFISEELYLAIRNVNPDRPGQFHYCGSMANCAKGLKKYVIKPMFSESRSHMLSVECMTTAQWLHRLTQCFVRFSVIHHANCRLPAWLTNLRLFPCDYPSFARFYSR